MRLILKIILLFVIILIITIFIARFQNARSPASCLYKKNSILQSVKPGEVGWQVPNCDIFGNYHSKQIAYEYYAYCVTKKGINISKGVTPYNELKCPANSITDWLFYLGLDSGLKILNSGLFRIFGKL